MIYAIEEQVPLTNSACCSSNFRCERCTNEAELRMGRRIRKRPAVGFNEPVFNNNFDLGEDDMYSRRQPAGGPLGIPEIDFDSGRISRTQPMIEYTTPVLNSFGEGPAGGSLGLPVMNFDSQPESTKPCGCPGYQRNDEDGPVGGPLGIPSLF